MAEGTTPTAAPLQSTALIIVEEDTKPQTVLKRYDGLMSVRTKAVKGKGAWYWAHLEPLLVHDSSTGAPKAVKLKCALCTSMFSASNPSRTASEHLKKGTCPNFNSNPSGPIGPISPNPSPLGPISPSPKPISSFPPSSSSTNHYRKRPSGHRAASAATSSASPAAGNVHTQPPPQQHFILSGGKEDLGPLAMLEDSVKKLKSPKINPGQALSKDRADLALVSLSDWVYESGGSVPLSTLEHPKFKLFLNHVGLRQVLRPDLAGPRLDAKYNFAKSESEARIRDALFFQVSSDGWKSKGDGENNLVNLSVNLPNGGQVFRKAVFITGDVPSLYAEEVLWEVIRENSVQRCVSIVSDRFKSKALKNLEDQNPWMINLSCQFRGFVSLIKDFNTELPLFKNVLDNCLKLAHFVNNNAQIRSSFRKYQVQEYGQFAWLRVPTKPYGKSNFDPFYNLIEDILSSARALHLVLMDESYKVFSMEEKMGREMENMMRDPHFWNNLEAVRSLVKLIKSMAHDIEIDRPLVGQCIPLWDEFKSKVKDWCANFRINECIIEKIIENRFRKNYHPAWSAAYVLDPLYLVRETGGKYIPPYKFLTPDQERDVDKLITRLVSREEAHIALMELMKWRTDGLEPVYAQAVQLRQRDPVSGKMKLANPQSSRLVWETHLTQFKSLGKVAVRLIFLHATSCGFKFNSSFFKGMSSGNGNSRAGIERAQKMIFIAAHSKLERGEFTTDEEREGEYSALANGESDALHEVFC